MRKKPRILQNKAQHVIEYTLVLTLVSAAIIIMSPYVTRSWNANMRQWEDSMQDSFEDRLPQTDPVIIINPCMCGPWTDLGCAGGTCAGTEMHRTRMCDPMGCPLPTELCDPDPRCCVYTALECGGTTSICDPYVRHYEELCGGMSTPNDVCGWFDGVTFNPGMQDPSCTYCNGVFPALPDPRYKGLCPGDDMSVPLGTWYVVVEDGNCTPARKCEIECQSPYFPISTTQCGSCPANWVWRGSGCAIGYCSRYGLCGALKCYCGPGGC